MFVCELLKLSTNLVPKIKANLGKSEVENECEKEKRRTEDVQEFEEFLKKKIADVDKELMTVRLIGQLDVKLIEGEREVAINKIQNKKFGEEEER